MLVLSRKENEEIVVGERISIRIVRIVGNRVRLGISAPGSISIRRAEVAPSALCECDLPLDVDSAEPAAC